MITKPAPLLTLMLVALCLPGRGNAGTLPPELSGPRQEIEQAYYARDAQKIEAVRASLMSSSPPEELRDASAYLAAYARFRQALLAADDNKLAKRYLNDCISELEAVVERNGAYAEAHALLASCYGTSSAYYVLRAPARGIQAGKHLDQALQLEPENPWVVLQDAIADFSRPAAFGGDKERALQKLRKAAELIAASRPEDSGKPAWGEAETWLYIGRVHKDAGRLAEAREALERALAMAPANRDIREELGSLK